MELKNALVVCLISLFAATVVLLIARTLDLQAAARLEPQLIRIADELETLRKQGGLAAARAERTGESRLVVYYFHGNTRVETVNPPSLNPDTRVYSGVAKAVRAVLHEAIARLRPSGERNMMSGEWMMYNILDLKFIQGKPVREIAESTQTGAATLT